MPSELLSGRAIGVGGDPRHWRGLVQQLCLQPAAVESIHSCTLVTLHVSLREDIAFVKPCSRRPLRRRHGLPCLCRLGNGSSCPPGLWSCLGHAHTRCFSLRRRLGLLCSPSFGTFASVSLDEAGLCLSFLLAGGLPFLSPLPCPGPGHALTARRGSRTEVQAMAGGAAPGVWGA